MKKKVDLIEFKGDNSMLYYEVAFNTNAALETKIIVPATHIVLLIKDGKVENILEAGVHDLFDKTKGWWIFKHKIRDSYTAKALYISKTAKVRVYWGTPVGGHINYVDSKLGYPIRLKTFGHLEIRVADAEKFYLEIVASGGDDTINDESGKTDVYSRSKFENRFRPKTVSKICEKIKEVIVNSCISYFDLDTYKTKIQEKAYNDLKEAFRNDYGVELCDFLIENFNISEEDEDLIKNAYKKIKNRQDEIDIYRANRAFKKEIEDDERDDIRDNIDFKKEILEDDNILYNNEKNRERDELEYNLKIKREEEDRAWERERQRVKDAKELEINRIYHDTVKHVGWEHSPINKVEVRKPQYCVKCGNAIEKTDLFCPSCGEPTKTNKLTDTCTKCGKEVSIKSTFCPYCGKKLKETAEKNSKKRE